MDQERRYNLASVNYYPALKSASLITGQDSSAGAKYIREFLRQEDGKWLVCLARWYLAPYTHPLLQSLEIIRKQHVPSSEPLLLQAEKSSNFSIDV